MNIIFKKTVFITLLVLCGTSLCSQTNDSIVQSKQEKTIGYEKTNTGLYYKITTKNEQGKSPQIGDYLYLVSSYDADFDSTLVLPPIEMEVVLEQSIFKGDVYEAFSLLREGEEGEFYIKADSFCLLFLGFIPPTAKPEDMLHFKIKLNEIKSAEEYAIIKKERQEMLEKKKEEEKTLLAKYIAEQKITVKPTASGLYYIEKKKGKGAKVEIGKKVTVHYVGKLLDGTVFDSSIKYGLPLELVLREGVLIAGFTEGLLLMKAGGKASFIIPSDLAYGENGAGTIIATFTTIIFEVKLIKVSKSDEIK